MLTYEDLAHAAVVLRIQVATVALACADNDATAPVGETLMKFLEQFDAYTSGDAH